MLSARTLAAAPRWVRRAVTAVAQGRGPLGAVYDRLVHRFDTSEIPEVPAFGSGSVHFVIGPANEAEQGFQWARALERVNSDVSAVAMMGIDPGGYGVQADLRVPTAVYLRSREWHERFERFLAGATHLVVESALPMLGRRYRSDPLAEARVFKASGLKVAMLFHGSDVRLPSQHLRENEWSPFTHPDLAPVILEEKAQRALSIARALGVPVFVSTPDLLRFVPGARWCPVVIDVPHWHTERPPSLSSDHRAPVVLHAPTNPIAKGSHLLDPILRDLEAKGLVEYRRVEGLSYSEMKQQYVDADIMLDQFLVGSYGAAACEAMAAGCTVVGHIDEPTRRAILDHTGLDVPIVEATIDTLDGVLQGLVTESAETTADRRSRAVSYVQQVHGGEMAARALSSFLSE